MNKEYHSFGQGKISANGKAHSDNCDSTCFQNTNPVFILASNKIWVITSFKFHLNVSIWSGKGKEKYILVTQYF